MNPTVKEEPSTSSNPHELLYDVLENGVKMETFEFDDSAGGKFHDGHEEFLPPVQHTSSEKVSRSREKCAHCPKAFPKPSDLKRHVESVHNPVKDFECDECHTFFTRELDVRRHKLAKHATAVGTSRDVGADERPHVCATCGLRFNHLRYLRAHKKTHERVRKFECPQCHRFLSRKTDFPRHERTCLRAQSANSAQAGKMCEAVDKSTLESSGHVTDIVVAEQPDGDDENDEN